MKSTRLILAVGLGVVLSGWSPSAAFQQQKEKSEKTTGEKKKGARDRSETSAQRR